MDDRYDYGPPERRAATGLPLGIMLLSMLAIAVYLLAGAALLDGRSRDVAAYVARAGDESPPAAPDSGLRP
ncbi:MULTISPECIES: hypothetical protein [Sinorhizobium]|jgi:hypothetical protein|uniref:hypothetical protein n=1 Tax=Sinorhizobium TaxID=28105 RepID=UPI0003784F6D|nr:MULTISPECIES: hypothetical protein [Sinorhizobium]PND19576.1 hypothetical protein CN934_21290 [Ensifer sp. MMN_5]PND29500.1 hypothetical protein CN933_05600 [Sinorhizobium sp. M4_45]